MKNDSRVPGPRKAHKNAQNLGHLLHLYSVMSLDMHKHDDVFINLLIVINKVNLSRAYYGLAFGEVLLDILHRSEGEVLLLGIVVYGEGDHPILTLNPGAGTRMGTWVFDPAQGTGSNTSGRRLIKGVFIAADISSVCQKMFLPGLDDQGLEDRRKMAKQVEMNRKGKGTQFRLSAAKYLQCIIVK